MGCITGLPAEVKKKELRLLLVGIAGSGKSTFSKQMQIIHNGGFEPNQAELYKQILMSNINLGMKQLLETCQENIAADNRKKVRFIIDTDELAPINEEMAERIMTVWEDPAVQIGWKERKESILIQLEYLLANINRILSPDFIPNNDDILRARHRSTGETSHRFEEKKQIWNIVDVGGQFSERTKWEVAFQTSHINAVLFFIALDEYDIANVESNYPQFETKFQLAVSVYEEIMNGNLVQAHKACRIVFLNKLDLFTGKIENEDRFLNFQKRLEYNGQNNVDDCVQHVTRFLEEKIIDTLPIHIHPLCGLDTSLVKKLTQDIKISIIASSLYDMGIL